MAFIPKYYPMNRYGGFNGRYQLGGDFFNYFKGIYPNILGYQGQSGGQSNLYSDDAQEYYKDLINRNSAYDNYTNKDAYFQDNPYDPLGGVQIGNWQSQGIPGFYEAMNTNFDQQQSRIDDFVDKDAKWADKIAASMQADLDTRRDEWDNKTGKIFNEAKTNQIMETGANIFSLMRGQEEYDNALKEDPLTLTNTGFKGFKYQLGGQPDNNLINTTGYLRGAPTFNNPFNIIPGGDITMKGVDEPILAAPSKGKPVVMQPGKDYNFPGASYVVEQRLNNYKHGGKMKNYKYGGKMKYQKGGGIKGNVQQGMFNNRFKYAELPTINQGPMNPFISSPDTRSIMKNINRTLPTGTAIPLSNQFIEQVPQIASGMDLRYADKIMDHIKQDAAIRAKMKLADPAIKNPFNTKEDGTKDKRFKKQYLKGYGKQVQTLGLSNRDDVKDIQKAMGMTGKEVDGVWGPKTQMAYDLWATQSLDDSAAYNFGPNQPQVASKTLYKNLTGYAQNKFRNNFLDDKAKSTFEDQTGRKWSNASGYEKNKAKKQYKEMILNYMAAQEGKKLSNYSIAGKTSLLDEFLRQQYDTNIFKYGGQVAFENPFK